MTRRKRIITAVAAAVILSAAFICVVGIGWTLYAQQAGLTPPPRPVPGSQPGGGPVPQSADGRPFGVGERLVFNVSWSSIPSAARLELEVAESGQFFGFDSYQIRTRVQTLNEAWSLFGEIDTQYTSYVDAASGLPHRLVNSVHQGRGQGQRQTEEVVQIDQPRQMATFADESSIQLQPNTFDLPSLVYAMRLKPLADGARQRYSLMFGRETFEVEAVIADRQRIITQSGTYNAVCVRFTPQKKLNKYRVQLWMTDDAQRLPVSIVATLPFGDVRAELISISSTGLPPGGSPRIKSLTDESGRLITNGRLSGLTASLPFSIGERLNYDISWGNFASVGRASFEVRQQGLLDNQRVFEFHGEAVSTGAARTLITVNDQVSSYALFDRLLPIRTDLRLREGRRVKLDTALYNLPEKTARLANGTLVETRAETYDLLSLYYAVRATDFQTGQTYTYNFLDANNRLRSVAIRSVMREMIGGPLGTRDTLRLDILTTDATPGLIAQAWISADASRLPIYFVTRTRFGELRFQMVSAINTR